MVVIVLVLVSTGVEVDVVEVVDVVDVDVLVDVGVVVVGVVLVTDVEVTVDDVPGLVVVTVHVLQQWNSPHCLPSSRYTIIGKSL